MADAHVDAGAVLTTPGNITVSATLDNPHTNVTAYGGAAGEVGLGAQVVIVNDDASQQAYLGNATSATNGAQITSSPRSSVPSGARPGPANDNTFVDLSLPR